MKIDKSWFSFRRDDHPSWSCPTCGSASLKLKPEDFHMYESAETSHSKSEEWFDADFVLYRFSATLLCTNSRCNEIVVMVGSGKVETVHEQDYDGQWDVTYLDEFTPLFFQPNLIPICVPENTPSSISDALFSAFSIIFANYNAAANQLRASIEVLLDQQGIKSERDDGGFLALGKRIENYLTGDLRNYKDRLSAIQWIGNDGSHGNGSISVDDLLDGLQIIESLLMALYPSQSIDYDELAKKIINKKKPQRS